ncbi:hypothetical protein [Clostridium chromiireducens]|uniref:Uncharacterized protein n=1 Tax=Clostridium chromiireducens TaxID=225345 RepID=A0A1V4IIL3_9CLOT|nr:hypothetical protein [Clostridium chromiireducens]OPJ59535.1 hypothetical protein CLCHR_34180 [Clostridium chromiireducens]
MRQMIYTRYSNDRNSNFNIRTSIYKEADNRKVVEKVGMDNRAEKHINNIYENYLLLKQKNNNPNIEINKVEYKDGILIFDYIEGETLANKIDRLVKEENLNGIIEIAQKFKNYLEGSQIKKVFEVTNEFIDIFGEVKFSDMQETLDVTNIDLSMDNIIISNKIYILDYEWVFNFPMPVKYVIYRNLNNYLNRWITKLEHFLPTLFQILGITAEEIINYNNMENEFLKYVNKDHYNIYSLYSLQKNNVFDINELLEEKKLRYNSAQVFQDKGKGFSEVDSYRVEYEEFNEQENILVLPIEDDLLNLRVDPLDRACVMKVNNIYAYKEDKAITEIDFISNAKYVLDNILLFETDDPQIVFNNINLEQISNIRIEFNIYEMEISILEVIRNLIAKNNRILLESEKRHKIEKFVDMGVDYIQGERKELMAEVERIREENLKIIADRDDQLVNKDIKLKEIESELNRVENEIKTIKQTRIWKLYEWVCKKIH